MARFVYVDNSGIWIEGKRVAAVSSGMVGDIWDAMYNGILDPSWRLDFGKLYHAVAGDAGTQHAYLYGSTPPPNDQLWAAAKANGFQVTTFERNAQNKEKKVDTQLTSDMLDHSYEIANREKDEFILVAGDKDYVPAVKSLRRRGFHVTVAFWGHAATELRDSCSLFFNLDPFWNKINR